MYLRKGDEVIVIAGKDKGKTGTIIEVKKDKVIVENLNIAKKHQKQEYGVTETGIIDKEMPIHVSNVMLFDESANAPTRVGFEYKDGKKVRISKKTNKEI